MREDEYLSFFFENNFIGFARIKVTGDKVVLGIGLKPSECSKGYGKEAMRLLVNESLKRYGSMPITLEVRTFNQRAINSYQQSGFVIKKTYTRKTPAGDGEFYLMEYHNVSSQ